MKSLLELAFFAVASELDDVSEGEKVVFARDSIEQFL